MNPSWPQRLNYISSIMSTIAFVLVLVIGIEGFRKNEQQNLKIQNMTERLESVEAVYESTECVLSTDEEMACDLGEFGRVTLASPDSDGEVRSLILRSKEGVVTSIGPLRKEATYVRVRRDDGEVEGYISDRTQGTVEVYGALPPILHVGDERLPIIIRRLFPQKSTSSTSP